MSPRKTFAIISHPDAGKTTLTERLLHAGGAIHLAGDVKGRGERRRTRERAGAREGGAGGGRVEPRERRVVHLGLRKA